MNDNDRSLLGKVAFLMVILMVIQLGVIGYVFYSQYEGRKENIVNLRAACERGKKDRAGNAKVAQADSDNWSEAAIARRGDKDFDVATTYEINAQTQKAVARDLLVRAHLNCAEAFPKARFFR